MRVPDDRIALAAPGPRVHATGIPWNDPSGDTLRAWLAVDRETFYDTSRIAIVPAGLCYPGHGPHGDLPPRPHPSPRNRLWLRCNPWFAGEVLPVLRARLAPLLAVPPAGT